MLFLHICLLKVKDFPTAFLEGTEWSLGTAALTHLGVIMGWVTTPISRRETPVTITQDAGWASWLLYADMENLAPNRESNPGPSSQYAICQLNLDFILHDISNRKKNAFR